MEVEEENIYDIIHRMANEDLDMKAWLEHASCFADQTPDYRIRSGEAEGYTYDYATDSFNK